MQPRQQAFSLATIVGLVFSLAVQTAAQGGPPPPPTNILFGFVTSNRTLTATTPGPIYYLPGDLIVNPGVTLTIEPGVTLRFTSNRDTLGGGEYPSLSELTIRGILIADGSAGDSIRFLSTADGSGQWGQIKIESGSPVLRRVAVRGAVVGVSSNPAITIENCAFSCSNIGVSPIGGGIIRSCIISDCIYGISSSGAPLTVQECVLTGRGTTNNGYGLSLNTYTSTAVADSTDPRPTIVSNFDIGVQLWSGATASHIVSHHNRRGLSANGNSVRVLYCTAVSNTNMGMELATDSHILSSIAATNGSYGIYTQGACPAMSDYVDSWSNPNGNYYADCGGLNRASFNPFFVNPGTRDYRLSSGSIFKTYGPWGAEIGAYGPGPGSPVPSAPTSWGRVKANYR